MVDLFRSPRLGQSDAFNIDSPDLTDRRLGDQPSSSSSSFAPISSPEPATNGEPIDFDQFITPKESITSASGVNADDRSAGRFESAAGRFAKGFTSAFSGILKGADDLATSFVLSNLDPIRRQEYERQLSSGDTPEFQVVRRLGESLDEFVLSNTDINPKFKEEFTQKIAEGLGTGVGFAAQGATGVGLAGGLTTTAGKTAAFLLPSLSGSTSLAASQIEDYRNTIKQQGGLVDSEKFAETAGLGAALGLSEGLPITSALQRASKFIPGGLKGVLKEGAVGGIEELTQEVLQTLGSNAIANNLVGYDPDRNVLTDVQESGEVGFAVGAILNTLMASIGARRSGRFEAATSEENAKQALSGIDVDEQTISDIASATKSDLKNPVTQQKFQKGEVGNILQRYAALHQLRTTLEERGTEEGAPVFKQTEENILGLIDQLAEFTTPNAEGVPSDAVKAQEAQEVINFIQSSEAIKGRKDSGEAVDRKDLPGVQLDEIESIDLKPISRRAAAEISRSNKEAIRQFRSRLRENALERGFNINRVVDDIEIEGLTPQQQEQQSLEELNRITDNLNDPRDAPIKVQEIGDQEIVAPTPGEQNADQRVQSFQESNEEIAKRAEREIVDEGQDGTATEPSKNTTDVENVVTETEVDRVPAVSEPDTSNVVEQSTEVKQKTSTPKRAAKKTFSQSVKVAPQIELPQSEIDSLARLLEAPQTQATEDELNKKFGGRDRALELKSQVDFGYANASEENVKLDEEQTLIANNQRLATNTDHAAAKVLSIEAELEALDDNNTASPEELANTRAQLTQELDQAEQSAEDAAESQRLSTLPQEIQDKIAEAENAISRAEDRIETLMADFDATGDPALQTRIETQQNVIEARDRQLRKLRAGHIQKTSDRSTKSTFRGNFVLENEPASGVDTLDFIESPITQGIVEDNSNTSLTFAPKVRNKTEQQIQNSRKLVESVSSKLTTDNLEVVFVGQMSEITDANVIEHLNKRETIPGGVFIKQDRYKDGKNRVYLFGQMTQSETQLMQIFMHEIVGHFGTSQLLGNGWNNFLSKVHSSNSRMRDKIFDATSKRWFHIIDALPVVKGEPIVRVRGRTISQKAMNALTDEYIAELATTINHGRRVSEKSDNTLIARTKSIFKHLLQKIGLGKLTFSDSDILSILSETNNRLFNDPVLQQDLTGQASYIQALDKLGISLRRDRDRVIPFNPDIASQVLRDASKRGVTKGNNNLNTITANQQELLQNYELDPEAEARAQGTSESDIQAQHRLRNEGFADVNTNWYQTRIDRALTKLANRPLLNKFAPLGNLAAKKDYEAITTQAQGQLETVSELENAKFAQRFAELNSVQRAQLFDFMTNRNLTTEDLAVNDDVKELAQKSRDVIAELGEKFADLGLLSEQSFKDNHNQYLARRYLTYLHEFPGAGKRPSYLNYLKKKKDVPDDVRAALGEIKDPAFLISETVATLSRDAALLDMFDNINKMSVDNNLDWVIRDGFSFRFKGKKVNLIQAQDMIDDRRAQLRADAGTFAASDPARQTLREDIEFLELSIEENQRGLEQRIADKASELGLNPDNVDPVQFLRDNYRQISNVKSHGALRGTWIRKEIFNDLNDTLRMFDAAKDDTLFNRLFGPTGKLVDAHSIWKVFKVALNPPSWFRNAGSNLVLLDISSRRNAAVLTKWVVDEIVAAGRGQPSKWFTLAQQNGLTAGNFNTQELFAARQDLESRLALQARIEENNPLVDKVMPAFKKGFMDTMEWASNFYGFQETVFKTVRMRDHIQQWEEDTGRKFDDLVGNERQVLIQEGVRQANEALFDYSRVPNLVKQIRRYPFGAPFLTFNLKALPQVARSFARRPHKFIKYAALPMLFQQLFLAANPDLDEDDYEQISRDMPRFARETGSHYLTPVRKEDGRFTFINVGHFLPWQMWQDQAMSYYRNLDTSSGIGVADSTLSAMGKLGKDLGVGGSPAFQIINGYVNNMDSFTGRPVVEEGASPLEKFNKRFSYAWNLAMPPWAGNFGLFGRMMDQFGISAPGGESREFDQKGRDKESATQLLLRGAGINTTAFDPQETRQQNIRSFQRERQAVLTQRRKILKQSISGNLGAQERARKLREVNERLKKVNEKQQQFLRGG